MSSLRTLVLAQNLPYPPFNGVDLRNWQNVNGLMEVSEVGMFGLCANDPRHQAASRPSMAFWRTTADPALTYPPPKGQKLAARAWLLDPMGHPSDFYYSDATAVEIETLMAAFKPHVVVIEGLMLHRYIGLLKHHDCRLILDSHDVEASLCKQIANSKSGDDLEAKLYRKILPDRVKLIEQKATRAVDQIWVCSDDDARAMQALHEPPAPIRVVPNAVDVDSYADVRDGMYSLPESVDPTKKTLVYPAMFAPPPNAVAATFLIEEVFPRLAAVSPDCQLLLVGSMPTPQMVAAAAREPRIVVTGAVLDIRPYLAAASAMIVPLFQGGGTRFKILEAFAANLPVISTAKGAEGLDVQHGMHLLIAESADEFVHSIRQLWADECCASLLAANGLDLVKQYYSWDVSGRRIARALNALEITVHPESPGLPECESPARAGE